MAESKQRESGAYTDSEVVRVKDAEGNVQPDAVPAAWVGTDLLPEGTKKATSAEVKKADSGEAGGSESQDASSSDGGATSDDGTGDGAGDGS
jgi:hypothetical protein